VVSKTLSRRELVGLLGKPWKRWATVAKVNHTEYAQEITGAHVEWNTQGALRIMQWICNPSPHDVNEIESNLKLLREQATPNEARVTSAMARAREALEAAANNCLAGSRVETGEEERWVLLRVCSRHRAAGLRAAEPSKI